jgi:hypothetical protein
MVPTVVHWCGRDYESGEKENWAQVTAAEQPRQVRVVGSYPRYSAARCWQRRSPGRSVPASRA